MSDDAATEPSSADTTAKAEITWEDLTQTSNWHGAPDRVLAEMSDFADGASAGVGVTLIIPGGVLSGVIISAQDYFATVAARFREAAADDDDEQKIKIANEYARMFYDEPAQRVQERVDGDRASFKAGTVPPPRWPLARYIHLRDADFIVPGGPALQLGLTRVLLSQIVGWTPGTLG